MEKIDLGQGITILANLGVIAGIVFLGIELRQNTAAVRLSAAQYLASEQAEINRAAMDPMYRELVSKQAADGYDSLSEQEKGTLRAFYRSSLNVQQALFYQYLQGSLDEGIWAGRCRQLVRQFEGQAMLDTWRVSGLIFGDDFRAFIETQIIPRDETPC